MSRGSFICDRLLITYLVICLALERCARQLHNISFSAIHRDDHGFRIRFAADREHQGLRGLYFVVFFENSCCNPLHHNSPCSSIIRSWRLKAKTSLKKISSQGASVNSKNSAFSATLISDHFCRLLTSHLQTHGNTVMIGQNITVLNMLINTLALFLSPAERNRSCYARRNHRYMPDLFLQGLVGQVWHASFHISFCVS